MSKFTPGPWVINRDESTNSCDSEKLSVEGSGLYIAQVDHCMHQQANAKLIAAAPELFSQLSLAVENAKQVAFEKWLDRISPFGDCDSVHSQFLASPDHYRFEDQWSEAIKAIAKAKGEA